MNRSEAKQQVLQLPGHCMCERQDGSWFILPLHYAYAETKSAFRSSDDAINWYIGQEKRGQS